MRREGLPGPARFRAFLTSSPAAVVPYSRCRSQVRPSCARCTLGRWTRRRRTRSCATLCTAATWRTSRCGGGRRAALTLERDHTYLTRPLGGGPRPGRTQIVAEKQCAFVSFLSAEEANAYFNWATASPPLLRGRQVRIGWGKPSSLSPEVAAAASRGATRKVYIGGVRRGLRGLGRVWGLGRACGLGRAWGLGRACGFGRE